MNNLEEALVIARAAIPYYEQQHQHGSNWHTLARLESAQRTVDLLEGKGE